MSKANPSAPASELAPAGESAREALALLDVLFRHTQVGLAYWDRDLRYARVNQILADINGVPVESHLGRTAPETLGAELGDEVESMLRDILASAEPVLHRPLSGETPAQPGITRHWGASYYPVMGEGRPLGVLAAVTEVTAERQARAREQQALGAARAAGAVLDALVEAAPVGIGFWNVDLRYERVNRALAEINGASVEDHLGRTPQEVMGEMGLRVMACLRRAIQGRAPVLEEKLSGRVRGRGGTVQHREGSWFPIFDAQGDVVGVGGVARDVTERHEAEAERSRLLEEAIAARAHAEEARRESEEARREAEEARGEAERTHARSQFLVRASARMAASMDYTDTLQQLAQTVVPALADWCAITTAERTGGLRTQAVAHVDPERTRRALEMLDRYPPRLSAPRGIGRVMRTGEIELTPDVTDDMLVAQARDEEHLALLRSLDVRSALVVPLRGSGATLGALTLVLAESGRSFSDDDIALAEALADRAALHIRNAQLYTERSHIARTLQSSLLPSALPEIPGVEVAARYLAAGDQNQVGGDFYDVFHADDHTWTALLGDVAGKGAEAAAVTSLARHTLRTAALHVASPARNLTTLNRALLAPEAETTRFCTVLYARIRPSRDGARLTFANGGHLAPLLLRAGGSVEEIAVQGTLIGAFAETSFEEVDVDLRPGDVVLMFTDGVTEVRGRRPEYGEQELDSALRDLAGGSAEEIAEGILRRAVNMHGGVPRDDMALVVIRIPRPEDPPPA